MSFPIFFSENPQLKNKYFTEEESKKLSKLRIIQKNLVHFQNFPDFLLNKELLSSKEYFGKYGKILKIMLVKKEDKIIKKTQNSAYITFSNNKEAANAILNFDSILIENNLVRAFFGTSKYCIHFLNNINCFNKEKCLFIHHLANENDYLGVNSKFRYSEHIKLAKKIIKENNNNNVNNINNNINNDFKYSFLNFNNDKINNIILPKRKNSDLSENSNLSNNTLDTSSGSGIFNKNNFYNNFSLFKSKKQSRFFNNNNNNNYNFDISDNLKYLIDSLLMRFSFFHKFNHFMNLNQCELNFCIDLFNKNNDCDIKFIIDNKY